MITRLSPTEHKTGAKRQPATERSWDDYDLGWQVDGTVHKVFLIDENEWIDVGTSSTPGRHRYNGPSLVVQKCDNYGTTTDEHYINDPVIWCWIRRSIAAGYLTKENQLDHPAKHESELVTKGP